MNTVIKPKRILILDDDPVILKLLDQHLRSCNFEPLTTIQWTEAMDLITHDPPDVVLLDIYMPTVQGDSFLNSIREQGLNLPVIIISAFLNEQKMETLQKLGVEEVVAKPFRLHDLVATIQKVLDKTNPGFDPASITPKEPPPLQTTPSPLGPQSEIRRSIAHASPEEGHDRDSSKHRHRRRPKHLKGYTTVAVICFIGSLAIFLSQTIFRTLSTMILGE